MPLANMPNGVVLLSVPVEEDLATDAA
jgi:hypothetical protein